MAEKKVEEYEKLRLQQIEKIESIAGMSAEEAKMELVESMKEEARVQAMSYISEVMDEARLTAGKEAKRIVVNTIQRVATETAIENAVTVFNIESDEIKGRIIGREGRNIRALEAATGVEIVVDDTPEAILLSAFDPVRRKCPSALHQLVTDGRIHPARRRSSRKNPETTGRRNCRNGKTYVHRFGYLGYMQNWYVWWATSIALPTDKTCCSIPERWPISPIMAAELGLNAKLAKRAGLLHDIGKVSDEDRIAPCHFSMSGEKYKERPKYAMH